MKRYFVFADNWFELGSAMRSFRGTADTIDEAMAIAKQWFLDDHKKNSPADLPAVYAFDGGLVCIWDSATQSEVLHKLAKSLFI